MKATEAFWERRRLSLERAWKGFRGAGPGSVRELSLTLERIALAARAAGDRKLERRARRAARRLDRPAEIETHRRLLTRVRRMGFLPADAAASLDARWEESARDRTAQALDAARGRPMRKLLKALSRRGRIQKKTLPRELEHARNRAARRLEPPPADARDRDLRAFHEALRKARDFSGWMAEAGSASAFAARDLEREGRAADAFDRWREMRGFERALRSERRAAEDRGSVTLALSLDRLIGALDASVAKARREAVRAARTGSNVVAFQRRSA